MYGPALTGPFVFDDQHLPFFSKHYGETSMLSEMRGVRPFLMLSFWLNYKLSGTEPYTYHLLNLLFHAINTLLVFAIVRRLLEWSGSEGRLRDGIAAFSATLFLLHPAQTESVSYVASRSENLSAMFMFGAIAVFVWRRKTAISWPAALAVLALYGAAASTKEHTVVLPAVLLLIDYFWNPGFSFSGIPRNWRLYAPIAVGGTLAARSVYFLLMSSPSAGFRLPELPWHHYLYTQWKALWVYLRLFVLPFGQSADYDYPIVRSALEPLALAGLLGLLVLAACAIWLRKRFPLASFGLLAALVLFAPTSSFIPIVDAITERRMYLPMLGLVLVAAEALRRWKTDARVMRTTALAVLALLAFLCYQRNRVWASETALWKDTVERSPRNWRAHFQLGIAYYAEGRCELAAPQFEAAYKLGKADYGLYMDWALAEDCLGRPDSAITKIKAAIEIDPRASAYSQMALIYGRQGKDQDAMAAIGTAIEMDANDSMAYFVRGNLKMRAGDFAAAATDYTRALDLNPDNEQARRGLARAQARLQSR
jgi:tetratricopeptide (TPR) repeat protein